MGVGFGGRKSKGSKAERELIHLFWANGYAAMRAAGSGSTQHPSPDIIAGNGRVFFAIECKASADPVKYIEKDQVNQLDLFANSFGARAFVALRFDNEKWFFMRLTDLKITKGSYVASLELAKEKGLSFEELIGQKEREQKKTT